MLSPSLERIDASSQPDEKESASWNRSSLPTEEKRIGAKPTGEEIQQDRGEEEEVREDGSRGDEPSDDNSSGLPILSVLPPWS